MQKGIINEKNFAELLDNKKVSELSSELRKMIFAIFKNIELDNRIDCWQSEYYEKADIKVKINNEIKGISIKTGIYCSMHQESIESLYPFFRKIGIEEEIIEKLNSFIAGYVNGKRVDSITYILHHQKDINQIKEALNRYYIKINLILRFIFQGTEKQKYDCDAIIYGTPENFLWATKDEILEYLINYNDHKDYMINFSALNIKCYDRNLRNNIAKRDKQNDIQIKWYTLKNDLLKITKNRKDKQNK